MRRLCLITACMCISKGKKSSSRNCHKYAACDRHHVLLRQARREAVAAVYETQPMPDTVSKLPTTGVTSDVA